MCYKCTYLVILDDLTEAGIAFADPAIEFGDTHVSRDT